jgi:hypothetical protein
MVRGIRGTTHWIEPFGTMPGDMQVRLINGAVTNTQIDPISGEI